MKNKLLFIINLSILIGSVKIAASSSSQTNKANKLIQHLCEKLSDDDTYSYDDLQWEKFCIKWFKSRNHQQHHHNMQLLGEETMKEPYKTPVQRPRRRGGFRGGGGSRVSVRASRSSSSSSSRRTSSSISRFRSRRTGVPISRPTGWLWSRSRYAFLPMARHYSYRSSSYSHRYTTSAPSNTSQTYYYCTSNSSASNEIQCSTVTGDKQCCEDEPNQQAFCCGGDIDSDLVVDFSQATQLLTRIFYTLAIIALCMHVFIRRFDR